MASQYEIGDAVPLTWSITVGGVPTNATVAVTVTDPAGAVTSPAVTNPATGSYATSVTAALNGTYLVRWAATGAVVAAESSSFDVGSDYCTLTELKASLGIADTNDDLALMKAIRASSRAIDRMTGTTFYPVTEARLFYSDCSSSVWVDRFTDATGLVVKTGTDGTYPTTVAASNVVLWPYNAPRTGDAYCRLILPQYSIPTGYLRPTVQVTASWGWATCPDEVAQACLIKAARVFRRKDSPEGIAGSSEFGVVRISKYEDPDVVLLLAPFMSVGIA